MKFRALLPGLLILWAWVAPIRAADGIFDFETLRYRARMLAARPYAPPATTVPESLRRLSYDDYRQITYNPQQTWWRREGLPFQLQFFHPGFVHQRSVQISELSDRTATPIRFSRDLFHYGSLKVGAALPAAVGFAGFRVL